jgi:hypothetical protein
LRPNENLNLILYNYEKFTVYWSKDGGPMLIVRTVFQAGYFCLVMFEGCKDMEYGSLLKEMFQANYFRIVVIEDETTDNVCQ